MSSNVVEGVPGQPLPPVGAGTPPTPVELKSGLSDMRSLRLGRRSFWWGSGVVPWAPPTP